MDLRCIISEANLITVIEWRRYFECDVMVERGKTRYNTACMLYNNIVFGKVCIELCTCMHFGAVQTYVLVSNTSICVVSLPVPLG